uniref:Uncharacterized protein n=1 Tax=Oryza punctata TaxID=4537 RepID=A0A0E0M7B3_ORYPU
MSKWKQTVQVQAIDPSMSPSAHGHERRGEVDGDRHWGCCRGGWMPICRSSSQGINGGIVANGGELLRRFY